MIISSGCKEVILLALYVHLNWGRILGAIKKEFALHVTDWGWIPKPCQEWSLTIGLGLSECHIQSCHYWWKHFVSLLFNSFKIFKVMWILHIYPQWWVNFLLCVPIIPKYRINFFSDTIESSTCRIQLGSYTCLSFAGFRSHLYAPIKASWHLPTKSQLQP